MPRAPHADRAGLLAGLAETFREFGYEGTTLTRIARRTGFGKGSLYHLYPGGKAAMAAEVLAEIDTWFERRVFPPLREGKSPTEAIKTMFDLVEGYFHAGRRVCLIGAFALVGDARDRFAEAIHEFFAAWVEALGRALRRRGHDDAAAQALAEEIVAGIQGALVLAHALDDATLFVRALQRLRRRALAEPTTAKPA